MLSWSLLSHFAVAQAWGAQTQCQRLDFPKVRARFCSPGNHGTILCLLQSTACLRCALLGNLLQQALCERLPLRESKCCNYTCWCGERMTKVDVINVWVTRWWLVFMEVRGWVIALLVGLLLRRASASWKVLTLRAEWKNTELYRRARFSENCKYSKITFSSFWDCCSKSYTL